MSNLQPLHEEIEKEFDNWGFEHSPVEFLPSEILAYGELVDFKINDQNWKQHGEVVGFFTDECFYAVGLDGGLKKYGRLPFNKVESFTVGSKSDSSMYSVRIETDEKTYSFRIKSYGDEINTILSRPHNSDRVKTFGSLSELYDDNVEFEMEIRAELRSSTRDRQIGIPTGTVTIYIKEDWLEVTDGSSSKKIPFSDVVSVDDYTYKKSTLNGRKRTMKKYEDLSEIKSKPIKIRRSGVQLLLSGEAQIVIYDEYRKTSDRYRTIPKKRIENGKIPGPRISNEDRPELPNRFKEVIEKKFKEQDSDAGYKYWLIRPFDSTGKVRIEEWDDGQSSIRGSLEASSKTHTETRGKQVGPFFSSESNSESTIQGNLSAGISDNTFETEVENLIVFDERLSIDSKIDMDVDFDDIESVFKSEDGLVISLEMMTLRVSGCQRSKLGDAVEFIDGKFDSEAEAEKKESQNPGDRLRELKELYQEGIISESEFESKKAEILEEL